MPAISPPALSIIVPVYNEQGRLPATLDGLSEVLSDLSWTAEVVVVDNGSTDRSADIVRAHPSGPVPIHLMSCATRGKGAAVRAGVLATTSRYVGFCDADLATDLAALSPALAQLGAGVNVVVGSRAHPESDVQARHNVARRTGASLFRWSTRQLVPGIADTQCGFKFFDRATADAAFRPLRTLGFAFDVEVLARTQRSGAVIAEIPVAWTDVAGSTFDPLHDGWQTFAALAGIRATLANEQTGTRAQRAARSQAFLDMPAGDVARGALRGV
ncbi:glycosyltransferase [Haloechinothrix sp. YIM 98757]|uniref:Glycosyltransferase n=1 Tax=Haloechinothrix aidingensis TaxID=2752311 RepID=A0A838AFY2_9PSEU|nr:glycosyltransferase [Haloechinothrix aidingensis]